MLAIRSKYTFPIGTKEEDAYKIVEPDWVEGSKIVPLCYTITADEDGRFFTIEYEITYAEN